jgi:hypothetical protein
MSQPIGGGGLFVKAGLHNSDLDVNFRTTAAGNTTTQTFSYSGTGSLFGAGFDWKYSDKAFARFSVTRYLKVGGESDSEGTVYSIGIGANF